VAKIDLIKISDSFPSDISLSVDDKVENANRLARYFEHVKLRMNEIFKYYTESYNKKTFFDIKLMDLFKKMLTRLSINDDILSNLILVQMSEIFFSISLGIIIYGTVPVSDIAKLDELPNKINSYIKTYNLKNTRRIMDVEEILLEIEVLKF
jgi:hypothetical protein